LLMGQGLPATAWMLIWPAWYLAAAAETNTL
jgi:hypothetical protein